MDFDIDITLDDILDGNVGGDLMNIEIGGLMGEYIKWLKKSLKKLMAWFAKIGL